MSFNIFTNNRMENLAERLIMRLEECAPVSIFEPTLIVVQSSGMQHWLRLKIAESTGICANVQFNFIRAIADKMMFDADVIENRRVFSESNLQWLILQLFQDEELLSQPELSCVKNYFEGGEPERKKLQLAMQLAGVFDQYIIYRPEWLLDWEKNLMPTILRDDPHAWWQKKLWWEITQSAGGSWHYAAFKEKFQKRLNEHHVDFLPPRISIFGISSMPPFFLDVFAAAANHCEVDLYYLNPCMEDWSFAYSKREISKISNAQIPDNLQYLYSGNDLLASLGGVGRDYFKILLDKVELGFDDWLEQDGDFALNANQSHPSMLRQMQSDILNLLNHNAGIEKILSANDQSIIINSCYSKQREIEVLLDQIMFLIKKHGITPDGIAVMAPDITAYAPYIEAVFGNASDGEAVIPYTIADRSLTDSNRVIIAFLKIVAMHSKRFTTLEVMDIFRTPEIYRHYQLEEQDLPIIRQYIASTNIRWSWDAKDKSRFDVPESNENSWNFGFDRLLMGLADGRSEGLIHNIAPCPEFEGAATLAVGAFMRFVRELNEYIRLMRTPHTLPKWNEIFDTVIDKFFGEDKDSIEDIQQLRSQLKAMNLKDSPLQTTVSPTAINDFLNIRLTPASQSGRFFRGGVTFCSLAPMRSIPFDAIVLVGMNNDEFPRNPRRAGFDLREQYPRPGDLSKRAEDRYIFLEALISARKHLIISYLGRDLKSNEIIPPSIVVSELLDYLDKTYAPKPSETIIRHHPLQSFSIEYFRENSQFVTYSQSAWHAARALNNRLDIADQPITEQWQLSSGKNTEIIYLHDLVAFLNNPAKAFITKRMNARLEIDSDEELKEFEDFELDPLARWQLADEIKKRLPYQSKEDLYQQLRSSGSLPYDQAGTKIFDEVYQSCSEMNERITELTTKQLILPPQEIQISLESCELHGSLDTVYPELQIFSHWSDSWHRYLMSAWVNHLALHAAGLTPRPTWLLCRSETRYIKALSQETAIAELNNLTKSFMEGMKSPLCFFPATSLELMISLADGKSESAACHAASKGWHTSNFSRGDNADIYYQKCFGTELPDCELLKVAATPITAELINSFEKVK